MPSRTLWPMVLHYILSLSVLVFLGCSSFETYDTSTADGAFKQAQEYEKFERYQEAITHYQQVKTQFPYSRFAKKADFKVAELQFKREAYPEAQVAYELFHEFYPNDSRAPYIVYRIGLSYFHQIPDKVGRDVAAAEQAILYFDKVYKTYPSSPYAKEAQKKRIESLDTLASKVLYIADYYFKQKNFEPALGRYQELIQKFHQSGHTQKAYRGIVLSAFYANKLDIAKQTFQKLTAKSRQMSDIQKVQKELNL